MIFSAMKLSSLCFFALILFPFAASAQSPPATEIRIAIVGDSTVQTYTDGGNYCGWGQILTEWAGPDTKVFNEARGGTSSKSFRSLGLWKKALDHKPQIVFIQFGHNDRSKAPDKGTLPEGEFSDNILAFINETKQAGAIPILVTPPCQRSFQAGTGNVMTTITPYARAMRTVGEREKVVVLDLFSKSYDDFSKLGPDGAKLLAPREGDINHFNRKGAELLAGIIMTELRTKAPGIAAHFSSAPAEAISPQ